MSFIQNKIISLTIKVGDIFFTKRASRNAPTSISGSTSLNPIIIK